MKFDSAAPNDFIVLYCIVLYCIVLYCIVLYCIVLFYSTSPGGKKMFFGVGIYGFSATITDSGSLIGIIKLNILKYYTIKTKLSLI